MSAKANKDWSVLGPQLDQLLGLSSPEQERWLGELERQGGASAANASQLRSLLSARDEASRVGFMSGVADPEVLPPTLAQSGDVLGAWALDRLLGEGGMGTVWLARRADGRFEGQAAIKLLRTGLFDRSAQERFKREGGILARLHHPGIAALLDAGVSERGQPYLVLEYVRGQRIDSYCDAADLSVRQRVELFLQVLDAVAAAHAQLIIHRDLKPSNILVDQDCRVRLLDFGLASLLDESEMQAQTQLTREGGLALTPEYAAPEQFNGEGLSIATDVFGLGVVLYELLTGTRPSGLAKATLREHQRVFEGAEFPLASTRAEAALLKGDLDNVLAKALAFQKAERYLGATPMAEDLRRYLNDEVVLARPAAWSLRFRKYLRRHRLMAFMVGVVLAVGVIGGVSTVSQSQRVVQEARVARIERDRALRERDNSEAAADFLSYLLSQGGDAPLTSGQMLMQAADSLQIQYADDPERRARLLMLVIRQHLALGDAAVAERLLRKAQAAVQTTGLPALQVHLACLAGAVKTRLGQAREALPVLDEAITALRAIPTSAKEEFLPMVDCLVERAYTRSEMGEPALALLDSQAALSLLGVPRAGQKMLAVAARTVEATALGRLGRRFEASKKYRALLDELQRLGRGDSVDAATAMHNSAVILGAAGQTLDELEAYQSAVQRLQHLRGPSLSHPSAAGLGLVLAQLGRVDEGLDLLNGARKQAELDKLPVRLGLALLNLSQAYWISGRLDLAEAHIIRARQVLNAALPPVHPGRASLAIMAARLRLARGDADGALQALAGERLSLEKVGNFSNAGFHASLIRAQVARRKHEMDQAQVELELALRVAAKLSEGFACSAWLGQGQLEKAKFLIDQKADAAARIQLQQASISLSACVGENAPTLQEVRSLQAQNQ